jgi:hypothetical protein
MPYTSWVSVANSKLRSLVDPPAPHVMLTAVGFNCDKRDMRAIRFSKPCETATEHCVKLHDQSLQHLLRARRKELERVERPAILASYLVDELHM